MDSLSTIRTLTTNESKNAHMNDDNDNGTNKTANGSNNIDNTTEHIVTITTNSTTTAAMSNNGLINTKVLGHIEHTKERAISILANTQPPSSQTS